MFKNICIYFLIVLQIELGESSIYESEELDHTTIYDLTRSTNWKDLSQYYNGLEKHWKICINCGILGLGTVMHSEYASSGRTVYPALIPTELLMTRLLIIDVSETKLHPALVLTLNVALQWMVLMNDPQLPTLLLFKFGYRETITNNLRSCVCKTPGISYKLAQWIASNLTHVVGVATDAPTLESEQTREYTSRTVSNLLGKRGIYIIENVNLEWKIPEKGCMALAMPLKMLYTHYVPTRLTAFCPTDKTNKQVVVALKKPVDKPTPERTNIRYYYNNLDKILRNY